MNASTAAGGDVPRRAAAHTMADDTATSSASCCCSASLMSGSRICSAAGWASGSRRCKVVDARERVLLGRGDRHHGRPRRQLHRARELEGIGASKFGVFLLLVA